MKTLCIYFLCAFSIMSSQLSAQPSVYQQHFDDILLIINYNHAHYVSIPILKEIYSPYFKHMVFYGPDAHPEVTAMQHHQGFFSYQTITDAMNRFPHFKGYLYTHDDCIINPWNFVHYDKNKIWFPYWKKEVWNGSNPMYSLTWPIFNINQLFHPQWYWWGSQWGQHPMKKALQEYPAHHKQILARNVGESNVIGGYGDIVYIPQSLRSNYIQLANIFFKHRAFLEIALPTICHSIADSTTWQRLEGYCWSGPALQSHDIDFNHPYKLSSAQIRATVKEFFAQAPQPAMITEAIVGEKVMLRSVAMLDQEQHEIMQKGISMIKQKIMRRFLGL